MIKLFKPLAILALVGFPLAVLGFRLGLFHFGISAYLIMGTALLAVAVFFIGMVVTFMNRRSNPEVAKVARTAAYIAMIPVIGLGAQIVMSKYVPSIHNISTDIENPPAFNKIVALRTADHNPLAYDAKTNAPAQTSAYPNVKTLISGLSAAEAHGRALAVADSLGWEIVHADAVAGTVEATETTLLWGFKDDIVIRITDLGDQRAIDLRSVSRIGRSDLGANAKRIESFLDLY